MKKLMLLIAFVTLVFAGYGQKLKQDEVPAAVKNSFNKKFPGIKGVEWSKESASEFEAEFEVSGNEQSANFDQSGKWLETETEIKKSALPANVQATIKKEFPDFSIEEAEKAETADGMIYEVEIEKGEVNYEVEISTDGKVIKKEEKKEKDDKD